MTNLRLPPQQLSEPINVEVDVDTDNVEWKKFEKAEDIPMQPPTQTAKISKDATMMKTASVRPNIFVKTKTFTIEGTSHQSKNVNKAR